MRKSPSISLHHTCQEAAKLFEKYVHSECIVVCSETDRPEGLLMRDRFFQKLGRRFGADLFYERSVHLLMDSNPLIVDKSSSLQELLDRALGRNENILYDCVIVTDQDAFAGILTVADLLTLSRLLQKQAVHAQVRTIRGTEEMIGRIDSAVSAVRQSSERGEALSEAMVDLTLKGKNELNGVTQAFRSISDNSNQQDTQIRDLQTKAGSIGTVSNMIRELADHCNLLAVNATIEAARAGEHGRGFSVVADEVRKLAAETKKAADQINVMIRSINEAVGRTAALVRNGREEAATSETSVKNAESVFEQLFHAAADNRSSAREIDSLSATAYQSSTKVTLEIKRLIEDMQGEHRLIR
jgi:methyl-accepting chemotaxis protein